MSSHKIGDLLAKVKRPGKVPKSEYLEDGEFPVIDQGKLPIAGYTNNPDVVLRSPLPITIFGDHTRAVKFAKIPFACGADGTQLLYPNNDSIDPTFFFYAVKNVDLSNYFYARHFKFLKEQKIELPPIHSQRRIASILSAYDDLIENNRRRIQLLEQVARLLYKEWFVHLRFPGHERAKIIDGVPEGWAKKTLGEIVDVTRGKNITKNSANTNGSVPVVAGGLSPAYYHDTANVLGPVITISASGANAGYVNLYHEDIWASDCSYISRKSTEHLYYLFELMKSKQKEIFGFQKGVAQPHVYPKDLQRLPLLVPKGTMVSMFEESVSHNFHQIRVLLEQNKLLAKARDLLLPRLMNGEVAV